MAYKATDWSVQSLLNNDLLQHLRKYVKILKMISKLVEYLFGIILAAVHVVAQAHQNKKFYALKIPVIFRHYQAT